MSRSRWRWRSRSRSSLCFKYFHNDFPISTPVAATQLQLPVPEGLNTWNTLRPAQSGPPHSPGLFRLKSYQTAASKFPRKDTAGVMSRRSLFPAKKLFHGDAGFFRRSGGPLEVGFGFPLIFGRHMRHANEVLTKDALPFVHHSAGALIKIDFGQEAGQSGV